MGKFSKTAIAMAAGQLALLVGTGASADDTQPAKACQQTAESTDKRAAPGCAEPAGQEAADTAESVRADGRGKQPPARVGSIRRRVAGIAIDQPQDGDERARFSAEGAGAPIRGMSHVRAELNGRDAFSANGGHALGFEDVPSDLVAGVDVTRSPSAEQVEGAIGGVVNLRTALPFDAKGRRMSATLQYDWSALKKGKPSPSGSFLVSDRWTTGFGEFGALVDLAHARRGARTDSFQVEPYYPRTDLRPGATVWVPKGSQWGVQETRSERNGVYAALQWKRDASLGATLTFLGSRHGMESDDQVGVAGASPYNIQVAPGATYDARGALLAGILTDPVDGGIDFGANTHAASRHSDTTDIAWHLAWRPSGRWSVDTDLQHIRAASASMDSTVGTAAKVARQDVDLRGGAPWPGFSAADRAYLADPANYYWAFTMEHLDRSRADEWAWRTDARRTFDNPVLRDLRFGVRFTERASRNENSNPSYHWAAITQPWQSEISGLAYLDDPRFRNRIQVGSPDNFFNRDLPVPALVYPDVALAKGYPDSYATLHGYYDALCKPGAGCASWAPASFGTDPAGVNEQAERTGALYAQLRFAFDALAYPIDGNVGLRYVRTRMTAAGYTVFSPNITPPQAGTTVIGPAIPIFTAFSQGQSTTNNYANALPSLNLRMKASDRLQFRAGVATGMSRPDFGQMQAYKTLSENVDSTNNPALNTLTVNNVSLTGDGLGNPGLRPVRARQVDLSAEWYLAPGGSFTIAAFGKQLDDLVINQSYAYELADVNNVAHTFLVTGPVNGASGTARGVELAYQRRLDMLPGWLSGFGLEANYTYIDSREKLTGGSEAAWCPGPSGGAGNGGAGFNGCDLDGRAFGELPLPGLSRHAYHVTFMYDRGPLSSRLAWNWRSRNLQGVNVNGAKGSDGTDGNPASPTYGEHNLAWGLPTWADSYGQLDASIAYKLTGAMTISLEAQNLLDAEYRQLAQQDIGMKGRTWSLSGPRYTAQVRYAF